MKAKYKIGDMVELTGIYLKDKKASNEPYKGRIIERGTDPNQLLIGGSLNVYVVDGVGTYGEGALKKI